MTSAAPTPSWCEERPDESRGCPEGEENASGIEQGWHAEECAPDGANEEAALKGQHAGKLAGWARRGRVAVEVASEWS